MARRLLSWHCAAREVAGRIARSGVNQGMSVVTQLDDQSPEFHRARYLPEPATIPAPLDPALVAYRETIPGGWYWTGRVRRGETLRLINTSGSSAISALFWSARDTSERYNAGDTVKLQWTSRLGKGRVLFSDMGRVLVSITDESCGRHDAIVGGSTAASNARRYGDATLRNTRDNFVLAGGKHGMGRADVPPCIAFFAGVSTDEAGRFVWEPGVARPSDFVDLRAEMDLLVALSNCPHPLDPAPTYAPLPVNVAVWRNSPIAADDLCRGFSEEAARGFENTDAMLARLGEI